MSDVSLQRRRFIGAHTFLAADATALGASAADQTEARSPEPTREETTQLLRHASALAVFPKSDSPPKRGLDVVWAFSCSDTMKAYDRYIKPLLRGRLSPDTVAVLHLIARSDEDLPGVIELRRVPPESYARAVIAVLEEGSKRRRFLPTSDVISIARQFSSASDITFNENLAHNCAIAANAYLKSIGVGETPAAYIDKQSIRFWDISKAIV